MTHIIILKNFNLKLLQFEILLIKESKFIYSIKIFIPNICLKIVEFFINKSPDNRLLSRQRFDRSVKKFSRSNNLSRRLNFKYLKLKTCKYFEYERSILL